MYHLHTTVLRSVTCERTPPFGTTAGRGRRKAGSAWVTLGPRCGLSPRCRRAYAHTASISHGTLYDWPL
ncbi:hypothetical protein GN956_G2855 [Arapaima gigas]